MHAMIAGYAVGRRYQLPTPLERVLEIILGPFGATLMMGAAAAGIFLLLAGGARSSHLKNASGLLSVGAFLLLVRTIARSQGFPTSYPAFSPDIIAAQFTGALLIGLPCLVLGSIAGGYAGSYALHTMRGTLEAACVQTSRSYLSASLDILLALTFYFFGFHPEAAAVLAFILGAINGGCSEIQRELNMPLLPERTLLSQCGRAALAVALASWVIADGTTSFWS